MSVSRSLLGLLEPEPLHGYTLRQRYDQTFGSSRAVASAQVYTTLRRLSRDGYVQLVGVAPGEGPDRRLYEITPDGVTELERWLDEPEVPEVNASRQALFAKVVVAVLTHRSAERLLDRQRQAHLARMRQLREQRRVGDPLAQLDADFEMFHLDADLKWIDTAGARLARITGVKVDDDRTAPERSD